MPPMGPRTDPAMGATTMTRWARAAASTDVADDSQAALAWLLAKSPVMLQIPGTSKVAHFEANLAAALAVPALKRELVAVA